MTRWRASRSDTPAHRGFSDPDVVKVGSRVGRRLYGSCTTPIAVPVRDLKDHEYLVRCRSCPGCLRSHQALWRMRAEYEIVTHDTNWFFTGTFRDQEHTYVCDAESRDCASVGCVGHECTRFLKRVRYCASRYDLAAVPEASRGIRYLLLFERHKSGALHCHALFHTNGKLSYRDIKSSWHAGFMDARIANVGDAGYVTKYATKDLTSPGRRGDLPRVRASRNPTYGGAIVETDPEIVAELVRESNGKDISELWEKNLRELIRTTNGKTRKNAHRMMREIAMKQTKEK